MPRHTADVIALILAVVVALVVTMTAMTILYIQLNEPGQDTSKAADAIGRIIAVLVASLVGYMAGRRINGH